MRDSTTGTPVPSPLTYRFADLTLYVGQRRLERRGEPIELGKLTYSLLVTLVESAPNVVTHDELVRRVWSGRSTTPETVTQRVKLLRDALHDDAERPRYVGLLRGQGYRLIPTVERLGDASAQRGHASGPAAAPGLEPRTSGAVGAPYTSTGVKRPSRALATFSAGLVLFGLAAAYFVLARFAGSSAEPAHSSGPLDFNITQLTSTGRAIMPAISPDGKFVVYAQIDEDLLPRSLWVRQIGTTRDLQIVAPDPASVLRAPTVSPDGKFVDFVKSTEGIGAELWRVPFLGGTPRRLRPHVSSPIGWSPDGKQAAFIAYNAPGTSLVAVDERWEDRVLATRAVPTYFVSLNIRGGPPTRPAWSPDGRLIALPELTDILAPRIAFIETATGAETIRDSLGSFVTQGVGWLGPSALVLSQPGAFGQPVQLWRMTYPDGTVTPLTNDLSSYIGVDVDASRTRLVTSRVDVRTSLWLADATGDNAVEVVPPTPFGTPNIFLSWAGDRLLYDSTFGGRPAIASIAPGSVTPEEVVADAFHVAAAPDGSAIVYGGTARGLEGLWRVDASGQRPVRLVSGFAVEPVVADRAVVYSSNRSGVQSPWIVPLDGGEAVEIVRENANALDVSPDGRWLAYWIGRPAFTIVTCELPRCSNRRELPGPANHGIGLRWTPDGKELAYIAVGLQNIWAMPLDGGAPHAITSFAPDPRGIKTFGWSRDGRRLAFIRIDVQNDVVLLSGLRP